MSDNDHSRFVVGATYQVSERTESYGRYEDQTGLGSGLSLNQGDKSNAFVFGIDSPLSQKIFEIESRRGDGLLHVGL